MPITTHVFLIKERCSLTAQRYMFIWYIIINEDGVEPEIEVLYSTTSRDCGSVNGKGEKNHLCGSSLPLIFDGDREGQRKSMIPPSFLPSFLPLSFHITIWWSSLAKGVGGASPGGRGEEGDVRL